MAWYFYTKSGQLVTPRNPSALSAGAITMSLSPYTSTPPEGFVFCDGAAYDGTLDEYQELFSQIGYTWGSSGTHFRVPDFRGVFPRGIISSSGGIGNISGVGGAKTHGHTIGTHTHTYPAAHGHVGPAHHHSIAHTHTQRAHTHGGTTLSLGPASTVRLVRSPAGDPSPQIGAHPAHSHTEAGGISVRGETGDGSGQTPSSVGPSGPAVPNITSSVSPILDSVMASVDVEPAVFTSPPVSHVPPYFTVSFIIKL